MNLRDLKLKIGALEIILKNNKSFLRVGCNETIAAFTLQDYLEILEIVNDVKEEIKNDKS